MLITTCLVRVTFNGPPTSTTVVEKESLMVTKDTDRYRHEDIQHSSLVQEQTKDKEPIEDPLLYNMDSSMGKMCLGKDVIEISSDRNEGSGDWDSPEYKDTIESIGKKEPEVLVFHKMYTEEDSDQYIAQCFVNGLYATYREINLEKNDNLISNDYAVKLYLKYEVRKGKKLVKKELMVLLRGEVYFVQFIINPKEDEFEPGLIFGRSFLRSANAMVNFGEGTITIQPDFDPFLLSSDEEGNPNHDNLEELLDFDIDEIPQTETDLPSLVCKMGKGKEAERRALAYSISMRYEMLEEVRHVIETLAYSDKYRKLLDEIWADKVKLDGKIKPEEERAMVKVNGHMLKEKKDPGSFLFPIRRKKHNYEVTGRLVNVLCQVGFTTLSSKFLILEIHVDWDAPIVVVRGFLDTIGGNIDIPSRIFTTFDGLTRQTFIRTAEGDSDDEEDYVIKINEIGTPIHNSRPIG
ncbi:hypothetical protein Tco_0190624, partial [Tanacetum coccineum]